MLQQTKRNTATNEPRTIGVSQDEFVYTCPLHLSLEYSKASGTTLMGLKKERLGWKRTSCFRVSECVLGLPLTLAEVYMYVTVTFKFQKLPVSRLEKV